MRKAGVLLLAVVLATAIGLQVRRLAAVHGYVDSPPVEVPLPRVVGTWSAPPTPLGAKLVVEVTDRGSAVRGATVRATPEGQPTVSAVTDAAGLATFDLPSGAVQVSAEAQGAIANRAVLLSPLLDPARVSLPLEVRGRVDVNVTDVDTQRPVEGALVEVHVSPTAPRQVIASLRTDAEGHATLSGLIPNEYLLSVSRDGYVSSRNAFVQTGTVHAVALLPHRPFDGRVLLPDGGPAPGATVTTVVSWEEPTSTTTRADGTFTLPYTVSSWGELCAQWGDLAGSGRMENAADGGLVLAPIAHLEGHVLRDEDDAPLEGVKVRAVEGTLESTATTDADGHFVLRGLCRPEPYATFERAGRVEEGELLSAEQPTTIHLSAPSAVRGVVVDDRGHGVAGAHVKLREPDRDTLTDGDGRFGFEQVKREVNLSAEEGERGGSTSLFVEAGQLVEVTLSVGPVRVKIPIEVLLDGKPAEGVWHIAASRIDGRPFEAKTIWHARGRVSDVIYATAIALPEGSFKVTATNEEGHGETELRVKLGEEPPTPIRLHVTENPRPPPKPTRPLKVRVLDAREQPVEGANVHCVANDWGFTRTGADGRGVCAMTGELPIDVKTRVGGATAHVVPSDWETEVLLRLKDAMTVRGQVVGDAGPSFSIEVNSVEELESFPFTTPQFALEDRPAVRTILCVFSSGARQGCAVVLPKESGEVQALIPVGPPGAARFTVADARGQPVAQPVLYVDRFSVRPTVDAGVVVLPLVPGQHVLIVNVAGGPERYETLLTIEPGQTRDLGRLELR